MVRNRRLLTLAVIFPISLLLVILAQSVQSEAPQTLTSHQTVSAFANTTYVNTGQALGSSNTYAVALGRLDGNASLDAFSANSDPEPNQVWLNDGSGGFSGNGQSPGNQMSNGVALADVNGDTFVDA